MGESPNLRYVSRSLGGSHTSTDRRSFKLPQLEGQLAKGASQRVFRKVDANRNCRTTCTWPKAARPYHTREGAGASVSNLTHVPCPGPLDIGSRGYARRSVASSTRRARRKARGRRA
eukprot:scaffold1941_cov377-Prasinococcus_capsulatus_cf.AAC.19